MIEVVLLSHGDCVVGFRVSGHAGYAESGSDVVCAGVTTAVQLTANGVTECAGVAAEVQVEENLVSLLLPERCRNDAALLLLEAFELQMGVMAQEYKEYVALTYAEV